MTKGRLKTVLILGGFIGIGILTAFLILNTKEELQTKSSIISTISLAGISVFSIIEGLLIKPK